MKYRQLTAQDRFTIARLRAHAFSQTEIARLLGRHRSTISRELKRNRCRYDGGYRSFKAQRRTNGRRRRSRSHPSITVSQWVTVTRYLRRDWSPEQIANTFREQGKFSISHESIYQRIWTNKKNGGTLYKHLRGSQKRRRKRYGSYDSRGRLAEKRHISERPKEVESRKAFGHWEIDTVMGKGSKHCIVTLVERSTGYTEIGQLNDRTVATLNKRVKHLLGRNPERYKTITADNGTEFHGYKELETKTGVPFYFCTPYHSWERGTNENTNGLIRQYLPKGTSMEGLKQWKCDLIARKLNTRPRKRLGWKTPELRVSEVA